MKPRICVCCGEPLLAGGNALSRNPNICASCSSLVDGIDETRVPSVQQYAPESSVVAGPDASVTDTAPDADKKPEAEVELKSEAARAFNA
jgi:hypothetical protein